MYTQNIDDQQKSTCIEEDSEFVNCYNEDDDFDDLEEAYYPVLDDRIYKDGITGNGYDSLYEYRKEFFKYIKDFE